ncbi:MAG: hypothetical protein WCK65_14180 [Rhodospirillaceae bacterium]
MDTMPQPEHQTPTPAFPAGTAVAWSSGTESVEPSGDALAAPADGRVHVRSYIRMVGDKQVEGSETTA